jgi:hypothetical protein
LGSTAMQLIENSAKNPGANLTTSEFTHNYNASVVVG